MRKSKYKIIITTFLFLFVIQGGAISQSLQDYFNKRKPYGLITDSAKIEVGYLVKYYMKPKNQATAYPLTYFFFRDKPNLGKDVTPKELATRPNVSLVSIRFFRQRFTLSTSKDTLLQDDHRYSYYYSLKNCEPQTTIRIKGIIWTSIIGGYIIEVYPVSLVYLIKNKEVKDAQEYIELQRLPHSVSALHRYKKELKGEKLEIINPELISCMCLY
jgi:hypothetical protein